MISSADQTTPHFTRGAAVQTGSTLTSVQADDMSSMRSSCQGVAGLESVCVVTGDEHDVQCRILADESEGVVVVKATGRRGGRGGDGATMKARPLDDCQSFPVLLASLTSEWYVFLSVLLQGLAAPQGEDSPENQGDGEGRRRDAGRATKARSRL